jgi:hypothetical protein
MTRRKPHAARLRVEPLAAALRALHHTHVFFELPALHLAAGAAMLFHQLGHEAVKLAAPHHRRVALTPSERDVLVAGSPEPNVAMLLVEVAPRSAEQRVLF